MIKLAHDLIPTQGFTARFWAANQPDGLTRDAATRTFNQVEKALKEKALSDHVRPSGLPNERAFTSERRAASTAKAYDALDSALAAYEAEVKKEFGWSGRLADTVKGIGIYRAQITKGKAELWERFHEFQGNVHLKALSKVTRIAPNEARKAKRAAKQVGTEVNNAKSLLRALERDVGREGVDALTLDRLVQGYLDQLARVADKARELVAEGEACGQVLDKLDKAPGPQGGWSHYGKLNELSASAKQAYEKRLAALRKTLDDASRATDYACGTLEDSLASIEATIVEADKKGMVGVRREVLRAETAATLDSTLGEIAEAKRQLGGARGLLQQFEDDKPEIQEIDSDAHGAQTPQNQRRLAQIDRTFEAAKAHLAPLSTWKQATSGVRSEVRSDPEIRSLVQAIDDDLGELRDELKELGTMRLSLKRHYTKAIEGKEPGAA